MEALAEPSDTLGRLHALGPRAWAPLLGAASLKGPRAGELAREARRGREKGEGAGREGRQRCSVKQMALEKQLWGGRVGRSPHLHLLPRRT